MCVCVCVRACMPACVGACVAQNFACANARGILSTPLHSILDPPLHRFHPLPLATHLLLTTPTSHTHTFHPLSTIVIHIFNFAQVQSMDDNCGEWVECMGVVSRRRVWLVESMGVATGCGCKEVYISTLSSIL